MKVYFNNVGTITSTDTTGDSLRQGSVGIELKAFFDDIDNTIYTASFNFTRNGGTKVQNIIMSLDSTDSECYKYKFDDPWFFAKSGATTLTIFLRKQDGTIKATGQVTFNIEATDYSDDPEITVDEYNALVDSLSEKASIEKTILTFASLPSADDYEEGQVIYVKGTKKLYELKVVSNAKAFDEIVNINDYYKKSEVNALLNQKQDKLVRDSLATESLQYAVGFDANGNLKKGTVSSGGSYTAGSGINLTGYVISIDETVVETKTHASQTYATKQELETVKKNAFKKVLW